VGYSRQSRTRLSDVEAGRIVSPEMQTEAARSYALARGWQWDEELTRTAIELGTSGGQSKGDKKRGESSWKKRRGLGILLEAAQAGRFAHLIVYKLSRLARSAREGLEICDAFERAGVAIHSASEGIDYSTATGRMIRTMMLAVAEMELENIREFAMEAMLTRVRSGKPHGPWPGWIGRNEAGEFVLVEPHASAHLRLVSLRLAGESYISIARALNREGYPTPTGKEWSAGLVIHALEPSARLRYLGHSSYQSGRSSPEAPHGGEEILLPCVFPALLTQAQYDELEAVQRSLAVGTAIEFSSRGNRRGASSNYPLMELAWCPLCGGKLVGKTGNKVKGAAVRSYACRRAAEVPGAHGERRQRVFLLGDMLEGAVLLGLATAWERFGEKIVQAPAIAPVVKTKTTPGRNLEALEAAEKRLWAAYEAGAMPIATLRTRLATIESEREEWLAGELERQRRLDAAHGWSELPRLHALTTGELRLLLRRLIARVEAPVVFEGVRIDRHNPHPARWARIELAHPLPDGTRLLCVALHPPRWSGPVHVHFGEDIPSPPPYYPPSQSSAVKAARKRKSGGGPSLRENEVSDAS
jgi:DNA invertase Pin-like site-specific DNA recombinase